MPTRLLRCIVVAAVLSAGSVGLTAAQASTRHLPKRMAQHRATVPLDTSSRIDANLRSARGRVAVMLQLAPQPAVVAESVERSRAARAHAYRGEIARIASLQRSVSAHFTDAVTSAHELYAVHAVYDGIAVSTDAARLRALAQLPGVVGVHELVPKHLDNTVTVPLIHAPQVWAGSGNDTGQGVTIGVIDTGIDYTHADFGQTAGQTYADAKAGDTTAPPMAMNPELGVPGYDGSKVVGGVDLVGDDYDPTAGFPGDPDTNVADEFPNPDPNPLDCNGHGTHVSGTAAGLGVTTAGATYTGSYSTGFDESGFSVGPGVAPDAQLYAIRIFGCGDEPSASSDVIAEALDWAVDPNGDGDTSDHLDVVNMSLGESFSSAEDPDAVAADNAVLAGVTVVSAAGNDGDEFGAVGSPGNAVRGIAVAASDDSKDIDDGLQVNSPSSAQDPATTGGAWPAEESVDFDWAHRATGAGIQGTLVTIGDGNPADFGSPSSTNNSDGCDPLDSADAAAVSGKIAFLSWTDADASRRCGSAVRTDNVANAGAIGAVFGDDENEFAASIAGDSSIPAEITTLDARTAILNALAGGPVTVSLTYALHNAVVATHPETTDTIASFSSRGLGETGTIKPDVSAPGVTVFSAAFGTGDQGVSFSGTSMATPHAAGTAALVVAAHPGWSPLQVKAALMNTATQDVCATQCPNGVESPERVGAGRIVADQAVATTTLAYADNTSGGVSVSFGPVTATTSVVTQSQKVKVVNLTSAPVSYTSSYAASDTNPGATYTTSPAGFTVPANGSTDVTVTLKVDPKKLVSRPDPTLVLAPDIPSGSNTPIDTTGLQRSFVSDVSGRLVLTPTAGGVALRVPVYAAPRHASAMRAPSSFGLGKDGTATLTLTGTGVDDKPQAPGDASVVSTTDAFELQGTSGRLKACTAEQIPPGCLPGADQGGADLADVGFASDALFYEATLLDPFSPDPAGDGSVPPALGYFGVAAYHPVQTPGGSVFDTVVMDLNGDGTPDAVLYNTRLPNSDVFVAELAAMVEEPGGFAPGPIIDDELLNLTDGSLDSNVFNSNVMTMPVALWALQLLGLDPSNPRISYWVDSYAGDSGLVDSIGDPLRGQTRMRTTIDDPALIPIEDTSNAPVCDASGPGECFDDKPGVKIDVLSDPTAISVDHPLGLLFLHHNNVAASQAQVVNFNTRVTVKLAHASVRARTKNSASITVLASIGTPTGGVQVYDGKRRIAAGTLSRGKVTLRLPALPVGRHALTVRYLGTAVYAASKVVVTETVKRT